MKRLTQKIVMLLVAALLLSICSGCATVLHTEFRKGELVKEEASGKVIELHRDLTMELLTPTSFRLYENVMYAEETLKYFQKIKVERVRALPEDEKTSQMASNLLAVTLTSGLALIDSGIWDSCSEGGAFSSKKCIEKTNETIESDFTIEKDTRNATYKQLPIASGIVSARISSTNGHITTAAIPINSDGTGSFDLAIIYGKVPKPQELSIEYSYRDITKTATISQSSVEKALASKTPPHLVVTNKIDYDGALKNGRIEGEESGIILVTVENDGRGTAWGVNLEVTGSYPGINIPSKIVVGDIPSGEKKLAKIPVSASLETRDGKLELKVQAKEQFGKDSVPRALPAIAIKQVDKPELSIVSIRHSDSTAGLAIGNGNGIVENSETVELTVVVKNSGIGIAKGVAVKLDQLPDRAEVVQASTELGNIPPDGTKEAKLALRFPKLFQGAGKDILVSISATDRRPIAKTATKGHSMPYLFNQPIIKVADVEILDGDDASGLTRGNRNHQIEQDESVEVRITIINNGTLPAENVVVSFATDRSASQLTIDKKNVALGTIKPGEKSIASFLLDVPFSVSPGAVKFLISVDQKDFPQLAKSETRTIYEAGQTDIAEAVVVAKRPGNAPSKRPLATVENIDEIPFNPDFRRPNAFALVVGVGKYKKDGITPLKYASADAEAVRDYLYSVGGFPKENIELVTDASATLAEFNGKLGRLKRNVRKDSLVVVYFSGHGVADNNGVPYLLLHDSDQNIVEDTGYAVSKLKNQLNQLPTKNILVALDACYTGDGVKQEGMKGLVRVEKDTTQTSAVILNASRETQASWEYPDKSHGIFTYFMLKGMRGVADKNGDGYVDVQELFNYLEQEVPPIARQKHGAQQEPVKYGDGNGFILTKGL